MTIYSQSLEKTHLECGKPLKYDISLLHLNSDNHGQKSWDKFTFDTRQTNSQARIHLHLFSPSPPPPPPTPATMLDKCTCYFSRVSTLYGGKGGGGAGEGKATQFETENSAFVKLRFKNAENKCNYTSVPRNFVHHCSYIN